MSIYKKKVNGLETMKNVEYTMSNNLGIYMNQTVLGENTAPYHGLFIKQEENKDEVYLSKMIEQIKINGNVYSVSDISTNEEKYGGVEFLEEFNRYPIPEYKYNIQDLVKMDKRYVFDMSKNLLCIEYNIENLSSHSANIKILPLVTKRGLFTSKRESMLKLNTDELVNGFKVCLSLMDKKFLYISCNDAKIKQKPHYINGVKCNYELANNESKMYIDDLYVPGYFEVNIKAKTKTKLLVYVSCDNIDITNKEIQLDNIYTKQIEKEKMYTLGIDENFFELKSLALSASQLNYIDMSNKKFVLLKSLPNININNEYLKHIVKSIEGNYILLKKYKEACRILDSIKYRLEREKDNYTKEEYYETLFVYIEALNKYINSEGATSEEKNSFIEYIKEQVEGIFKLKDDERIIDNNNIIRIDNKSYLSINIYWYNVLKIYLNNVLEQESISKIYNIVERLKDNLLDTFYDETNKVLRYEASEEAYASSDMLLAMDLSYPLIYDKIAMKIIDTAFKELYTPYGMRMFSAKSGKNDGYVYPHLMAAFVNANLRQNGVTRATQKIAYNLVKELLQEINKETIGSIKYKYHEKTKKGYGMPINSLTNSEIIRLYNMLI